MNRVLYHLHAGLRSISEKQLALFPLRIASTIQELNRQFTSTITAQFGNEPYSILVTNCLDYVKKYFQYEEELLKYSPWLLTRLKQQRHTALARNDFERLFDKSCSLTSTSSSAISKVQSSSVSTTSVIQTNLALPTSTLSQQTTKQTTIDTSKSFWSTNPVPETSTWLKDSNTNRINLDSGSRKQQEQTSSTISSSPTSTDKSTRKEFPAFPQVQFTSPSSSIFQRSSPTTATTSTTSTTATTAKDSPANSGIFPFPVSSSSFYPKSNEENEEESSEPPQPEQVKYELDAKISYKCRMAVKKGDKLIKRGQVQVHVKEIESSSKRQMIIRSDDSLGRLFLNIQWSKNIEMKKNSTKDITFWCMLNPAMSEIAADQVVIIILRFDNETERNEAYDKIEAEKS
ncbi:unnamed protein product [Didymodactylos carnosus]|uniref:RanBD1 domain-containing protein n=1 Tax=Didymodactylos carnosus TaxID=1234261 RepID=A0A8S2HNF2_9BILA|nr:unnamed protein product [Didymodactylos carnosus]CAF3662521.1 unnamed protein product [Didymodactylos carnosus]